MNAEAHASTAVAVANTGVAGQLIVVVAGNAAITGASTSCTLMVCVAVELLPHASVAVHVLVTLYWPAHAPFVVTSAEVNVNAEPHASTAVAVANTGVAGQLMVVAAGKAAITGAFFLLIRRPPRSALEIPLFPFAALVLVTLY